MRNLDTEGEGYMNTLRGRLVIVFMILSLGGLAVIGFLGVNNSGKALIESAEREGMALGKGVAGETELFFRERLNFLRLQSQRNVVRSMEWETQKAGLQEAIREYDGILDVLVLTPEREERYLTGAMEDAAQSLDVSKVLNEGKRIVSPVITLKKSGKKIFLFAVPILSAEGATLGLLAAAVDTASLEPITSPVRWGATGYAFVADQKGIIAAHPNKVHVAVLNASVEGGPITTELATSIRKGLAGEKGLGQYSFEGFDKYVAFHPVPTLGGVLAITSTVDEFLAPVRGIRNALLVAGLIIVLLVIAASLWMAGSIAKPIDLAAQRMKQVAEGDLTSTVKITSSLREVRMLEESINSMITLMSASLGEIRANSRSVLSRAEDMSAAAEQFSASIDEVLARAERSSTNTESSAAALEETNAGVEEVAAGAQAGARSAAAAGEEAVGIAQAADAGGKSVQAIEVLIGKTASAGEKVSDAVENLAETVKNISGFVATITSIADQTNLLALNAAIEAARAGDAGRGFAVVAEEVRKLAEDSNRAAGEIGKLIGDVTNRTESALKDTKGAASIIEELVERANETNLVIEDVVKRVNVVTEQIQTIAAAMEEQSASAEEMTAGMDSASRSSLEISEQVGGIALSMNEQSKALSSITASSEELVRLSEAMERSVAVFRMKEEEPLGLMPSKPVRKS